ncbi:hypothetical protein N9M21_07630 [Alphaproteobacteria bacterium]|nr:hypothetical protein [Alphaproteobacteria bacterium]
MRYNQYLLLSSPRDLEQPEHPTPYSYANDKRPFEEGHLWFWGGTTLDESKVLASSLRTVAHEINNARPRPHPTKSNRRDRPRSVRFDALSSATEKVLGSLILLSQTNADWIFWRPLDRNSFSKSGIGANRFFEILDWLQTKGLVIVNSRGSDLGQRKDLEAFGLKPKTVRSNIKGKATRWRTTEIWPEFCQQLGVDSDNFMSMYQSFPSPPVTEKNPEPAVVRASKKQSDYSPEQVEIAQRQPWFTKASADMADYLDFLKQQTFEELEIRDLHRQFREDGRYGRLHAAFQNRPRHLRNYLIESGRMRINRNPVLYVDVASSWPTIIAGHYGLRTPPPMHSEEMHRLAASEPHDHYMPILSSIRQQGIEVTRDEVKEAMSAVIASKNLRGACERTRSIRRMVVEHSPALQLYLSDPTTDRDDLFLMESDALMMALLELKQFNIPAVPVHDALIIEDRPGIDTEHLAYFALTRAYASIANARAVARVEVRSQAA